MLDQPRAVPTPPLLGVARHPQDLGRSLRRSTTTNDTTRRPSTTSHTPCCSTSRRTSSGTFSLN
jgi:hypothetical protein